MIRQMTRKVQLLKYILLNNTKCFLVPSKPRLVARSTSPKSPWKYHKVPTISAEGVPEDLKGLFSCILWRLHEFENNPLKPENFVLLSNDNKTTSAAQKIDIPVKDFAGLRDALLRETASNDHRAEFGELESIFPSKKEATITTNGYIQVSEKIDNTDNGFAFAIEEVLGQDEEVTELKRTQRMEQAPKSVTFQEGHVNGITESAETPEDTANAMETDLTSLSKSVTKEPLKVRFEQGPGTSIESDSNSERLGQTMTTSSPPASEDGGNALGSADENENGTPDSSPEKPGQAQEPAIPVEEDSDDDEEVVVFKPRSRRASGLLKSAPEPEKSKVEPIVQPTVQPMAQVTPAQKIVKTQIESTLKPQSPVFVPRNVQVNDQPPPQPKDNIPPVTQPTATDQDEDQAQVCIGNAVKDKPEEKVQEKVIPRSPRSHHPQLHPVPHPQKKLLDLNSKRNEGLIQRQREAIHRQAQATRPQPRKIQLHPTASPTVIDPDDFDRSYVVQPRVHTGAPANGVHRGGRRGSPKRAPRTPEPEVDFVLKSGSPRGSMRGKGKLWVP